MYNETLEILMEGITCPVKEQILKNQLEYHFRNKTQDNRYSIDNTVAITRYIVEKLSIMDLISVQPIAQWNSTCLTLRNDEHLEVETQSYGSHLNHTEELIPEINEAIGDETVYSISKDIIESIVRHAPQVNNVTINVNTLAANTEHMLQVITEAVNDVKASWIILGTCEAAFLRCDDERFTPVPVSEYKLNESVALAGYLDNDIAVYTTLHLRDHILVGSTNDEYPPIVYAPETIIKLGDYQKDENRYKLLSTAETFIDLDAVDERYRKIEVFYEKV